MSDDKDCYVYIIAKRDGDRITSPVKVGITGNVGARMAQFQTACPFPIVLVHTLHVPARWMARQLEGCFHETQRQHRAHGEWFEMPPLKALQILLLHFRWGLQMSKMPRGMRRKVLEISGAGRAGEAVIERLQRQDTEEGE